MFGRRYARIALLALALSGAGSVSEAFAQTTPLLRWIGYNMPLHGGVQRADLNGDGWLDAITYDTNGDGRIDAVRLDPTSDGWMEAVMLDRDRNGSLEAAYLDLDRNGTLEIAALDRDENGSFDIVGFDRDGDGVHTGWASLPHTTRTTSSQSVPSAILDLYKTTNNPASKQLLMNMFQREMDWQRDFVRRLTAPPCTYSYNGCE